MTNIEKSKNSIYQKGFGWTYVGEEMAKKYNLEIDRFEKRMKDRGECLCPRAERWYCNQDCASCKYHTGLDDDVISEGIVAHSDRPAHKVISLCSLDAEAFDEDENENTVVETIVDPADSIEESIEKHELSEALAQALMTLAPEDHEIIRLAFVEKLSDARIADELGIKARTTLSSRKIRIIKDLRDKMKNFF